MDHLSAAILIAGGAFAAALGVALLGVAYMQNLGRNQQNNDTTAFWRVEFFKVMGLVDALPVIAVAMGLYLLFAGG